MWEEMCKEIVETHVRKTYPMICSPCVEVLMRVYLNASEIKQRNNQRLPCTHEPAQECNIDINDIH